MSAPQRPQNAAARCTREGAGCVRHLRDHGHSAVGHCADEVDGEPAVERAPAFEVYDVLCGTNDPGHGHVRRPADERLSQRL